MNVTHDKLHALVAKRNTLNSEIARLKGKLEGARASMASLEEDCRKRGVEPGKLPETIGKLKVKLDEVLSVLEDNIVEAERRLAPFQQSLDL